MAAEEGNRIFVGGLMQETTARDLERAFSRFGDILDTQVLMHKDTGRSRGYGFITFSDRRAMDESIREMNGKEFGDRIITVNRAEPRLGRDVSESHGSRGGGDDGGGRGGRDFRSGGRRGPVGGFSSRGPAYGGYDGRIDRYADHDRYVDRYADHDRYVDRERYVDDQYDGCIDHYADRDCYVDDGYAPRFGARDRFDSREGYITRDRYVSDRYAAPADRFTRGDRYSRGSDRYPPASYDKARSFERDVDGDRYGGGRNGGAIRGGDEGRGFRSRASGPYERPSRSSGSGVKKPDRVGN